ncbi:MAG: DUF302 domain-containing protein [Pseudomonadota bacterium]
MKISALIAASAIALAVNILPASAAGHTADLVIKDASGSVAETTDALTSAVEEAGATLFTTVDHSGGAMSVDMELPDTKLVIFGNPVLGTPVMQSEILSGLDLPLRVLIFSQDGATKIAYLKPEAMAARYGIEDADQTIAKITGALDKLTDAAAQ